MALRYRLAEALTPNVRERFEGSNLAAALTAPASLAGTGLVFARITFPTAIYHPAFRRHYTPIRLLLVAMW